LLDFGVAFLVVEVELREVVLQLLDECLVEVLHVVVEQVELSDVETVEE
jgi:hypothetical protein